MPSDTKTNYRIYRIDASGLPAVEREKVWSFVQTCSTIPDIDRSVPGVFYAMLTDAEKLCLNDPLLSRCIIRDVTQETPR